MSSLNILSFLGYNRSLDWRNNYIGWKSGLQRENIFVSKFHSFSLDGCHIGYKTEWKMFKIGRFPSQVVGSFQYAGVIRRPDLRGKITGITLNVTLVKVRL